MFKCYILTYHPTLVTLPIRPTQKATCDEIAVGQWPITVPTSLSTIII